MKKGLLAFIAALCLASAAQANPTGAPLLTFPVHPCRIMDTRVALGPLASSNAYDAFVRGNALPPSWGGTHADCGVPESAEAVVVNVTVLSATGPGNLRINGTGWLSSPKGIYSRVNFTQGQIIANEMQVSLCNVFLYPHPHEACPYDGQGSYLDFQISPAMPIPGSVHVIIDVLAYLARIP